MTLSLIERAAAFAAVAHALVDQKRKYTGEDYIVHPNRVADLVRQFPAWCDSMVAAAYLHDTIEDTDVTDDDIQANFGQEVWDLVNGLTDRATRADGNREQRNAINRARLAAAGARVQAIKCCDYIDNIRSIALYDQDFWVSFRREISRDLDVLHKAPNLLKLAVRLLIEAHTPNPDISKYHRWLVEKAAFNA